MYRPSVWHRGLATQGGHVHHPLDVVIGVLELFVRLTERKQGMIMAQRKGVCLKHTAIIEAAFEDYRTDTHIPSFPPSH